MPFKRIIVFLILSASAAIASAEVAANEEEEAIAPQYAEAEKASEPIILNAPALKPTNIITIRAIGMGVAKEGVSSRAQEMALAKRAAILDGYRQLGEKLHGIKINGRDTVKDATLIRSEIRAEVHSVIRGAEVLETIWDKGLCQVEMEVKIDGRRWYKRLAR